MPRKKAAPVTTERALLVFDPNSFDSQFATLHALLGEQNNSRNVRMDAQEELLQEIKAQTTATNGRVTVLEKEWDGKWKWIGGYIAGASAVIVGVVSLIHALWH